MMIIQNKKIGEGCPVFIAAEIGINHNGDIELAKQTIKAAAEAGVDGVKFQNYQTEDFIIDKKLEYEYRSQGRTVRETQYEMFKRYELAPDQLAELKECCESYGLVFFSTPTGLDGIEVLKGLDVPLLKNGSDFLVNLEVIGQMARTGIPTVISTGMATLAEIDDAVRTFEGAGGKDLIILHCTSSYPTPQEDVNLKKMKSLQQAFGYPVGFSDHTEGIVGAVGAVCLGACFIEKHFTLDRNLPGPDHRFSSDPAEMKALVDAVRYMESALGVGKIGPTEKENYGRINFRLSCVAKSNLPEGHRLERNDIVFSRPATGIPPKSIDTLLGKTLKKSIQASSPFTLEHIL